jgi:hypothetical protein
MSELGGNTSQLKPNEQTLEILFWDNNRWEYFLGAIDN